MKVPECKLCGKAHWSSEEHADIEPNVPGYVREMARGALGGDAVQIKRTGPINGRNKRTRGRPRKWSSEAERKRTYRERSK